MDLFNRHWDASKQVKSSQYVKLVVKVKNNAPHEEHLYGNFLPSESDCGLFFINLKCPYAKLEMQTNSYFYIVKRAERIRMSSSHKVSIQKN